MNDGQQALATPSSEASEVERSAHQRRELQSVLADLWEHSETLVRQELELLKAEYESRAIHAKAAVQRGAISLGLFHAAYLTTLATLVLVLALWIEPWAASLIVAIAASAGAFAFALLGKRELNRTTESSSSREQRTEHRHALGGQRAHS